MSGKPEADGASSVASVATTAFVFAGGGGLASVQVGMLKALVEQGICADCVTGTSSGALNAVVFAAEPGEEAIARLARLWLSAHRRDLLRVRPVAAGRGLIGSAQSLVSNARLRRLLTSLAPVLRLEDTAIPIGIVAADAVTRRAVVLRHGDAVDALLATTAMPGLFPPVEIDGRELVDGGMVDDPPLGAAIELGATRAYVLPVGWPIDGPHTGNATERALDAFDWLSWRIAEFEIARWSERCEIHVLPSPSTRHLAPFDLSATSRLIEEAYELTSDWLRKARETEIPRRGQPPP